MSHLLVSTNNEILTWIKWGIHTEVWTYNGLEYITSERGYKLYLEEIVDRRIILSGDLLSPQTSFPLYGYKTNWAGYYLTESQNPFEAIAPELLDKITWMAGQYWFCHKETSPPTKSTGYWWRCACEKGSIELNYGDMIEIFPSENIDQFQWQNVFQSQKEEIKESPTMFSFVEQAEYDALIIELDTTAIPLEIGAFAGDSCIGATKVLPDDTIVLICAYTSGFEGQEITFQSVYSTKSGAVTSDDYYVLNPLTAQREKRRIVAGEKQPWFDISFTIRKNNSITLQECWIRCYPNPGKNLINCSYYNSSMNDVKIYLFDYYGREVNIWGKGIQNKGIYHFTFNSSALPQGVYLLQLNTGGLSTSCKLIIIE